MNRRNIGGNLEVILRNTGGSPWARLRNNPLFQNNRISLLKHCAMINDLEELLDRSVDLIENGTLLPFAVESAERDKKLIYERTA